MSRERLPELNQPATSDESGTPKVIDDSLEHEAPHEIITGSSAGYDVLGNKSIRRQRTPEPRSGDVETKVNEALILAHKLAPEGTYLHINPDGSVLILNKKPRQI